MMDLVVILKIDLAHQEEVRPLVTVRVNLVGVVELKSLAQINIPNELAFPMQ